MSDWYKEGVRILMLIHRQKDGGKGSTDRNSVRRISRDPKEFDKLFLELQEGKNKSDLPLRIYSSVNERNLQKAVKMYKIQQVEIEFQSLEMQANFYIQNKNQFYSCLAKPECAMNKKFLIDFDDQVPINISNMEYTLSKHTEILNIRRTPNGVHFITNPFNPSLVPEAEIKNDAMLLLDW